MRINARLDEHSEKNLEFIKQVTGENITQIIKDLLEERARQLRQKNKPGSKFKALLESDFVGCAEGPEDLSTNYKDYIHQTDQRDFKTYRWKNHKPFQNLLLPD